MIKEISVFCEKIKVDYSLFLYNHKVSSKYSTIVDSAIREEFLEFPFCCKVSADIITSFLQMNFGECFQYYCTKQIFPHGWTEYRNDEERFIIDFTNFQFDMCDDDKIKWRERLISQEEVKKVVQKHNPVQKQSVYDDLKQFIVKEKCIGVRDGYSGGLTQNSFMDYLQNVIDNVYKNTRYNI